MVLDDPRSRQTGFTLVEIAIAMSIFGVLALASVGTMATNSRASSFIRENALARDGARSQLDQVLAWEQYSTLESQFDGATFTVDGLETADGTPCGRVTIDGSNPLLLTIRVRVDWLGPNGTESCEITTMRTDYEWGQP